jgi:hypothetical protein
MRYACLCIATAVALALSSLSSPAEPAFSDIEFADQLFKTGKFAEAADIYKRKFSL